jgi:ferredoxin-like protein FixX
MSRWVIRGIRTGIKTTGYPRDPEHAPGVTPGLPVGDVLGAEAAALAERCPTGALDQKDGYIAVDYRRCVHCYRCVRGVPRPLAWQAGYEWAGLSGEPRAHHPYPGRRCR